LAAVPEGFNASLQRLVAKFEAGSAHLQCKSAAFRFGTTKNRRVGEQLCATCYLLFEDFFHKGVDLSEFVFQGLTDGGARADTFV
jgi:hypothetical protein